MANSRSNGRRVSDAHEFDQFLKKLETTKQPKSSRPDIPSINEHADNGSDDSTYDSRNESTAFCEYAEQDIGRHDERQQFETRQCFVDRRAEGRRHAAGADSVDSFIERAQSGQSSNQGESGGYDGEGGGFGGGEGGASFEELQLLNRNSDTKFFGEGLPDAILKLDRREAIPTPRHKSDVLVEIEASTVDRRELMVRPGVRCTESLPQGITTTGTDCIGRIVQLTTHARAIYGLSIDDRVAAIYPFEYKNGYKDQGRRNNRYALVDAGFVVTVPKHLDAAEASCMVRLYLSAFQSIQKGIPFLHDRYDVGQLKGLSVLVQNGYTELGRVLIELTAFLGASQIFATGEPEHHPLLEELGAIPLGSETFGWELFIEEKISLVLVQDMPTAENFEQFISILDENRGNMVYIHHGHSHIDEDDLGINADDVSCDGLRFHELAKKAKHIINSAKFSLRLTCSPKYIVYEGVWPSCKGNQSQFKEDLRYLFTILGRGGLKPNVNECIGLEEVAGVQDRIELLGKEGTIVCLPTALYEKKIHHVVSPENSPRRDPQGFPVVVERSHDNAFSTCRDDPLHNYASDAGYVSYASDGAYVKTPPAHDTLSDFRRMHNTRNHSQGSIGGNNNLLLPALPEATPYSHSNSNQRNNFWAAYQNPPLTGSTSSSRKHSGEYNPNDAYSMISSMGYSSPTNASAGQQTALSDSIIQTRRPINEEDPPQSIQFHNRQSSRRRRALHARAKERWKRNKTQQQQQKKNANEKNDEGAASSPTYTTRKMRRESRLRGHKSLATGDKPKSKMDDGSAARTEAVTPKREQASALAGNSMDENPVLNVVHEARILKREQLDEQPISKYLNENDMHDDAGIPERVSTSVTSMSVMDEKPVPQIADANDAYSEAGILKGDQTRVMTVSVMKEKPVPKFVDMNVVHGNATLRREQSSTPGVCAIDQKPLPKTADANPVHNEARIPTRELSSVPTVSAMDKKPETSTVDARNTTIMVKSERKNITDNDAYSKAQARPNREHTGSSASSKMEDTDRREQESSSRCSNAVHRPGPSNRSHDAHNAHNGGQDNELQTDSRDDKVDASARDNSTDDTPRAASFKSLMMKWKAVDGMSGMTRPN